MEGNREGAPEQVREGEMNINTRDRLFHAIFLKVGLVYSRTVPKAVRTGMEVLLLAKAIILFAVLSYVHFTFSKQPMTCLESVQDNWPRDGILRVQVLIGHSLPLENTIMQYPSVGRNMTAHTSCHEKGYIYKSNRTVLEDYNVPKAQEVTEPTSYLQYFLDLLLEPDKVAGRETVGESAHLRKIEKLVRGYQNVKENYIMEFALEYGFLRLSPMTRQKLKIPVKVVNLDPATDKCFGDSVSKFLLNHFLGYDDVLIASIKRLAEMEDNRGFMRNVITGEHYRFVSIWMSRSSYIIAFLLMFVFTISVATLLRFCHQQIFFFIVHLLQMLDWNLAVAFPVAPLFTVILSLVGMEVIMSEFFNDASTSFYIILIVWAADQFDSICCHTTISQKYWLRFFYLYHFVFYAYHYRFNGQYSCIALASSWFFIQHSMLYFLHNYELPAIENQAAREIEDDLTEALVDIAHAVQEVRARREWLTPVDVARGQTEMEGPNNSERLDRREEGELTPGAGETRNDENESNVNISVHDAVLSSSSSDSTCSSSQSEAIEGGAESMVDGPPPLHVDRDTSALGSCRNFQFRPDNGTCIFGQFNEAVNLVSSCPKQDFSVANTGCSLSTNPISTDSASVNCDVGTNESSSILSPQPKESHVGQPNGSRKLNGSR